jgi:16S rRNA C1402 (ribose-2'-O) methylase RsmI
MLHCRPAQDPSGDVVVRGTLEYLASNWSDALPRGEITLVVSGAASSGAHHPPPSDLTMEDLCAAGLQPRQAAKLLARIQGRSSREVYQEALRAKHDADPKP